MAMSIIDNASAQLAIALQLRDLDELEASGTVDRLFIRMQRHQLEIDSGFDAVAFEASRRLAVSMAKAVEDDSTLLAPSMRLPQIDDATFNRLALLNHEPSTVSKRTEFKSSEQALPKRKRSLTPEDEPPTVNLKDAELRHSSHSALDNAGHRNKKVKGHQITRGPNLQNEVKDRGISSVQDPQPSITADVRGTQMMEETPKTAIETSPTTTECLGCSDHFTIEELVNASCEHSYCKDCFGIFIEASLERHDGFPPICCKVPIAFLTIAENVSTAVFSRYNARQAEIKNATAIYCGIQGCGVRIEKSKIDGVRATCIACLRDTCTQCRGEFPEGVNGQHVCKEDKARDEVLALAKREGWQTCYQCGNMVALNFGCHHMQ